MKHDIKKHGRVYYCETCQKTAHRDISSAIVHLKIADCEVAGVRRAQQINPESTDQQQPFKVTHERKYSETDVVKFYRPLIYLHENLRRPVKQPKHQQQQSSTPEGKNYVRKHL